MSKYLAIGARTDCRNIVEQFAKLNTMRYHKFTEIWRELKFPYIFYGHSCLEELIEFTEEVIRIAKEMWLKSEALNEQAGGLYTLYGLYLKQPTDGLVKVRLTPKDYEMVEKFHEKIKVEGHHDVNYILARMHIIGAFRFCVSEYPYGLEKSYRVYHENDRSLGEVKGEPLYIKRLKNDDIFNKLEDAFKEYHISKCNIEREGSQKPPSLLRYVDPQFGHKLKEQFRTITQKYDDGSSNIQKVETQVVPGSSKSISRSKNSPSDGTIKLPWWMMPVRNHYLKKSASESDGDSDSDSVNNAKTSKKRTTPKDRREALNVALGMSGDEEEDDENEKSQNSGNICVTGGSHHMPDLL